MRAVAENSIVALCGVPPGLLVDRLVERFAGGQVIVARWLWQIDGLE